jgi:hypothetical protein
MKRRLNRRPALNAQLAASLSHQAVPNGHFLLSRSAAG